MSACLGAAGEVTHLARCTNSCFIHKGNELSRSDAASSAQSSSRDRDRIGRRGDRPKRDAPIGHITKARAATSQRLDTTGNKRVAPHPRFAAPSSSHKGRDLLHLEPRCAPGMTSLGEDKGQEKWCRGNSLPSCLTSVIDRLADANAHERQQARRSSTQLCSAFTFCGDMPRSALMDQHTCSLTQNRVLTGNPHSR